MNDNKDFFDNLNTDLGNLYNLKSEDFDDELYPIQKELSSYKERFSGEQPVAAGAMKKIISVMDLPSGRRVAKAVLLEDSDKKAVESFLREARLTATLQHPNIIRIYDIGMEESKPWFSMEYIEGESLQDKIDFHRQSGKDWPIYQRLEIFNKVCDALAYAHSKNILHLDVKPDNIRLGLYGEVIVCDWGLAHYLHDDEEELDIPHLKNENTLHGHIRGTPGFLAPERIDGTSKTTSADIFSLGALLYSLMTYECPFQGKNLTELLDRTMKGDFVEPVVSLPVSVQSVYKKALKVNISERYSSVQEMQSDIEKYRNGFATLAEEAGFVKQFLLFCNRNRKSSFLVLCFVILIGFILFNYIKDINKARKIVVSERDKAKEALALFKKEEAEKKNINKVMTKLLIADSMVKASNFDIDQALVVINEAVKKDPNNLSAWTRKGYTHFVRHEFKQAYDALEYSLDESFLAQLVKNKSLEYLDRTGLLTARETVELLRGLPKKEISLHIYFMMYDSQKRASLKDHSMVVKYLLEALNETFDLNYKFNEKELSLDLSNNPSLLGLMTPDLEQLSSFCILKTLNLKKLNLANSGITDLNQLRELKSLQELNLEKTLVLDLRPLKELPNLQKVYLNRLQKKLVRQKYPFEIVSSTSKENNSKIEAAVVRLLKNFTTLDSDSSGFLSVDEMSQFIPKETLQYFLKIMDVDKNADGQVSKNEIRMILNVGIKDYDLVRQYILEVGKNFESYDRDNNKAISLEEFRNIRNLPHFLPLSLFQILDKDDSNSLTQNELKRDE